MHISDAGTGGNQNSDAAVLQVGLILHARLSLASTTVVTASK